MACDVDPSRTVRYLRRIGERPQFNITKNGDYTTYEDMRSHKVAKGVTLLPEHVSMHQVGEQHWDTCRSSNRPHSTRRT